MKLRNGPLFSDAEIFDLIERMLGGDSAAKNSFVESYQPWLLEEAKSRHPQEESVGDIVQTVFLHFIQTEDEDPDETESSARRPTSLRALHQKQKTAEGYNEALQTFLWTCFLDGRCCGMLKRLVAGDQSALDHFGENYLPLLLEMAKRRYRYLSHEDVVQKAFLYFHDRDHATIRRFLDQRQPGPGCEAALLTFLWNATCGIASNELRGDKRDPHAYSDPENLALEEDSRRMAEEILILRDALQKLLLCIEKKDPKLLLYALQRFQDEKPAEEIARSLEVKGAKQVYPLRQKLMDAVERCRRWLGL